ncbi:MAG: uroporphyrinogen decarboxylase family protein [bacterium]
MTSRERVLLAADHVEPDRLAVFKPNIIPTREPFDERVQRFLDTFEFDRLAGLGGIVGGPGARRELSGGLFEDGYGCRFQYTGVGSPYCVHHPLAHAETVDDVERFDWPDPEAAGLLADDARKKARETRQSGEYATSVSVDTLFHRYHYLRGFERWMMDVKLCPALHDAIADRIHHVNSTLAMRLLDQVGEYTDFVCTGDDFGTSRAPYMSPQDFRARVKPYYCDLIGRIKGRFPHVNFYLHSHGQIMDLVPDLVECGVDVLNPVLPLDNMDPGVLKRDFGRRLTFHGGIDIERVLPFATLDEVRDHVRRVIGILAPGGGFWFKAQAVSPLIPPDNLLEAYRLALEEHL